MLIFVSIGNDKSLINDNNKNSSHVYAHTMKNEDNGELRAVNETEQSRKQVCGVSNDLTLQHIAPAK